MVVVRCRINRKKISRVAEDMGLVRPVEVIRTDSETCRGEYFWNEPEDGPHLIGLSRHRRDMATPTDYAKTILHELKHAEQCERLGRTRLQAEYMREDDKLACDEPTTPDYSKPNYRKQCRLWLRWYYTNPFERDAEDFASCTFKKYPHLIELYG